MFQLALEYGGGHIFLKEIAKKAGDFGEVSQPDCSYSQIKGPGGFGRGARGGHMLTGPPSDIYLREVVESLEGGPGVFECVSNPSGCPGRGGVAERFWSELDGSIGEIPGSTPCRTLSKESKNA